MLQVRGYSRFARWTLALVCEAGKVLPTAAGISHQYDPHSASTLSCCLGTRHHGWRSSVASLPAICKVPLWSPSWRQLQSDTGSAATALDCGPDASGLGRTDTVPVSAGTCHLTAIWLVLHNAVQLMIEHWHHRRSRAQQVPSNDASSCQAQRYYASPGSWHCRRVTWSQVL
jgi:hypothetical protein